MNNVKVEKIEPVTCPECEGTNIAKVSEKKTECYDCSSVFEKGKDRRRKDKENLPRGYNPRIEMGDYIEGTMGVHEYK